VAGGQPLPPGNGRSDAENSCAAGACRGGVRPRADAGRERQRGDARREPRLSWQTNGNVTALAYANGAFLTVDGQTRTRLAAFDTATGNLTSWNARTNAKVAGLAVSPDNHTIYVAGWFSTVNGQPHTRLGW
jgi:hypothetical protein